MSDGTVTTSDSDTKALTPTDHERPQSVSSVTDLETVDEDTKTKAVYDTVYLTGVKKRSAPFFVPLLSGRGEPPSSETANSPDMVAVSMSLHSIPYYIL
jgi:hypothetical protein